MTDQPFDPQQYKERGRQQWDSVAAGWRKWWRTFESGGQHISDHLVDLAGVQPGHKVLDIATGIGEPALTAARRVGTQGRVTATDSAPQMLALAAERGAEAHLDNLDFREMDAEALDFTESSFDAILCRWGLMFLPNLEQALGGIRRLLRPGRLFAAAVLSEASKMPALSMPTAVIGKMIEVPTPPPGTPGPFALADIAALEQTFRRAGFSDVRSQSLTIEFQWPSAQDYTQFTRDVAAPVKALLAQQAPEMQDKAWAAITEAAAQFAQPDGTVAMHSETFSIVGRR